jgi:zinc protease
MIRSWTRLTLLALSLAVPALAASAVAALEPKVIKSASGVSAWFVEDRTAPVIYMSFAFRPGALRDPPGKEGAAYLATSLLDEGAGDLDALAFQRRMEDLALSLDVDAQRDVIFGTVRTLARNKDEAFKLVGLALSQPRFDKEPIERVRAQIQAHLKRELRDPGTLAYRGLMQSLYPDHPYGRSTQGTLESIARVTAEDLHAFQRTAFARDNLIVGIIGDVDAVQAAALLDAAFGALPEKTVAVPIPDAEPKVGGKTLVTRLAVPQSVAAFGHGGMRRDDPDYFAAIVMNHILGGGTFSSRLYNEVREKRGLAYSVGSYLYPLERGGLYLGSVATENGRVRESIDLIRAEWKRLARGEVDEAEVEAAKTYITGSYALRFASASALARMLVNTQIDGMTPDYFERRNDMVRAIKLDDIKRVAARLLQADNLTFVVVGDPSGM